MDRQKVIILGATGSIGESALKIIRCFPEHFQLAGISYHGNHEKAAQIVREFHVPHVYCSALADSGGKPDTFESPVTLHRTFEELLSINYNLVIIAVVGAAGVTPAYHAAGQGRKILLANKESLVIAGNLIRKKAGEHGSLILPVDSEHNSILRLLAATKDFSRITITASGGALRDVSADEFSHVTVKDVLKHPTWSMGAKITVDSATMVNKALEVIEATHLFNLDFSQIDAVIHPESYIHAILTHNDGSTFFHVYKPDMVYAIAYCMFYPGTPPRILASPEVLSYPGLTFYEIDPVKFPAYYLGLEAGRKGGAYPAIFNAANEEAVRLFLNETIRFTDIAAAIADTLSHYTGENSSTSLEKLFTADQWARNFVSGRYSGVRA